MLNNQPIEKVIREFDGFYQVHSIFETIQGEGPFCGTPCVFLRLAGCNLNCPLCDTDYTSSRTKMNLSQIMHLVTDLQQKPGLVVVTGGEPFRQPIGPLLDSLTEHGYYVQIETNGTLPPPKLTGHNANYHRDIPSRMFDRKGVYIVCSPKTGYVHPDTVARACCFKYVVSLSDIDATDGLPKQALNHVANPRLARPPEGWDLPIYLQPADHKDDLENAKNTCAALVSCMKFGYTLQLQIHKFIGLP
jgi:organic radical activating enzyme